MIDRYTLYGLVTGLVMTSVIYLNMLKMTETQLMDSRDVQHFQIERPRNPAKGMWSNYCSFDAKKTQPEVHVWPQRGNGNV